MAAEEDNVYRNYWYLVVGPIPTYLDDEFEQQTNVSDVNASQDSRSVSDVEIDSGLFVHTCVRASRYRLHTSPTDQALCVV